MGRPMGHWVENKYVFDDPLMIWVPSSTGIVQVLAAAVILCFFEVSEARKQSGIVRELFAFVQQCTFPRLQSASVQSG